jgi:uncharacterized membrane protein YedE/YeeE
MKGKLASMLAGLLFGLGLAMSGMIQPAKVVGFLDLFGNWDPSLALVMAGGLVVTAVGYRLVLRRETPLFADVFHVPKMRNIDRPLLIGAALFGVGWGIGGYCPGPGVAALATLGVDPIVFVAFMLLGFGLHRVQSAARDSSRQSPAEPFQTGKSPPPLRR